MKNTLATILSIVIAATLFSSCDNDPDIYMERRKKCRFSMNLATQRLLHMHPYTLPFLSSRTPRIQKDIL